MRILKGAALTASVIAALIAGCASGDGSVTADPRPAQPDTSYADELDRLFFDLHSELVEKLGTGGAEPSSDPAVIETEAMVKTAEELYLEGQLELAVRLLSEARLVLEKNNR